MSMLLNSALRYMKSGIAAIPVWPDKRKNPKVNSYTEYRERLPSAEEWERWAAQWPRANIALLTGYHAGLCALDFDGIADFNTWWIDVSPKWRNTWIVESGRGKHVYFYSQGDPGRDRTYTKGASTVLLRAMGAYIIAPPSIHHMGRPYRTVKNVKPVTTQTRYILAGWEQKNEKKNAGQQKYMPITGKLSIFDWVEPYSKVPNGRGAYQCFCPFHDDDNPSAWVNPGQNRFGCNSPGCQAYGWHDVINVIAMSTGHDNAKLMSNFRLRGNPLDFG